MHCTHQFRGISGRKQGNPYFWGGEVYYRVLDFVKGGKLGWWWESRVPHPLYENPCIIHVCAKSLGISFQGF